MRYAVGIPTCGREELLWTTLRAFVNQDHPPERIYVVDNNDEHYLPHCNILWEGAGFVLPDDLKDKVTIVANHFFVFGDSAGGQTALMHMTEAGFDVGVRWDDDLVPEPDCIGKLVKLVMYTDTPVAGGMYPSNNPDYPNPDIKLPNSTGMSFRDEGGGIHSGDGHRKHLQFFRWEGRNRLLPANYLYSSFAYDIKMANLVGGFCTEYSRHSFRADTDFAMRMNKVKPPLMIDTSAVAIHHWGEGGTRTIKDEEKTEMMNHDLGLFDRRMRSMGINPDY